MENTNTQLDKVRMLPGTFLVKLEDSSEQTSETGVILSTTKAHKSGVIVKASGYELSQNMKRVTCDDYKKGDKIMLSQQFSDKDPVTLDKKKYHVCTRNDIKLIMESA